MPNVYYDSAEAYLLAVADALATEYELIAARDLVLQVDCPDLAMERHTSFADRPLADFLAWIEARDRCAQSRAEPRPARARAHARVLGQLRGAARVRRAARGHSADPLSRAGRRAGAVDGQSAPRPRAPLPDPPPAAAGHAADCRA